MVQKLDSLLKSRGIKQAAFERSVMLSENRISKWKNGQGEPSATEALRMARALGVPLEWLIDDMSGESAPSALSEGEKAVIDLIHALGLDKQEALRRLATPIEQHVLTLPGSRQVEITQGSTEKPNPKRGAR